MFYFNIKYYGFQKLLQGSYGQSRNHRATAQLSKQQRRERTQSALWRNLSRRTCNQTVNRINTTTMKREEYTKRVNEMCAYINCHAYDNMARELKERKITNPLTYGAWCERNFELNLREDYKRMTTCTSDLSIAEWYVPIEGMTAISATLRNMVQFWRGNIELMAEIIIVLNMKAWEHAARQNANYAAMYSELYLAMKDLYFDWFDESNPKCKEAARYYLDYVD